MNRLFIGAHPDDIEISCIGTIIKHLNENDNIILFVASYNKPGSIRYKEQKKSFEYLLSRYKNIKIYWEDYTDLSFNKISEDIKNTLEDIIDTENIDIVYSHYYNDTHIDHRTLSQCAIDASRKISLIMFESPTSRNYIPNYFVELDINIMEQKHNLLAIHESQNIKNNNFYIDKISGMAKFRGLEIYSEYAESFYIYRLIHR